MLPSPIPASRLSTAECPHCGAKLATEVVDDGTMVLCAACGQSFVLRPAADARRYSRKALASLVLGISSILFWCPAGIPAVVLGAMALVDIRRSEEQLKGRRLAVTGIVVGCSLGLICFPIALAFLQPAFQGIRRGK